ncbi:hypothetical protein [Aureimonas ureilytica]|uniref:hypothetical protein n=1 Tax=Aureimonas ureilytica TaxID=401562 RepID=UPI00035D1C14|nr:hypothetical protein [Aureimonas ureilytica]
MTIGNNAISIDSGVTPSGPPRWTLADFLSTYRYWALFLSFMLVALGGQGGGTVLPLMLMDAASTYQTIGMFHLGISMGWIVGAFLAFVVAPRNGRAALIWPCLACAVITTAFLFLPGFWSFPAFLIVFGLACGAAQGVFPLALAVFLTGGRPGRTDFAGALLLLSPTVLIAMLAPMGASMLYEQVGGWSVVSGMVACLLLAVAVLVPARGSGFEDAPSPRHRPGRPRRRSPLAVAAVLLAPFAASAAAGLVMFLATLAGSGADKIPSLKVALASTIGCITLGALVYLAVWLYRIHGELAGAAPSQRLLTPFAAVPVALLVPFGMPVLLITLADLLNDRARGSGKGQAISIAWLVGGTVFLPPVAIAMVQSAANRSYDAPGEPS